LPFGMAENVKKKIRVGPSPLPYENETQTCAKEYGAS
jgi:hypothetical protein